MPKYEKHFVMTLDPSSIDDVYKRLVNYNNRLKRWCDEFINDAQDIGYQTARSIFPSSTNVEVVKTENGFELIASGRSVCFMEFGAGWGTDVGHPYAQYVSIDVRPGSWSSQYGLGSKGVHPNFADDNFWFFAGKFYDSVSARRGMYESMVHIKEYLDKKVAEELL